MSHRQLLRIDTLRRASDPPDALRLGTSPWRGAARQVAPIFCSLRGCAGSVDKAWRSDLVLWDPLSGALGLSAGFTAHSGNSSLAVLPDPLNRLEVLLVAPAASSRHGDRSAKGGSRQGCFGADPTRLQWRHVVVQEDVTQSGHDLSYTDKTISTSFRAFFLKQIIGRQ